MLDSTLMASLIDLGITSALIRIIYDYLAVMAAILRSHMLHNLILQILVTINIVVFECLIKW